MADSSELLCQVRKTIGCTDFGRLNPKRMEYLVETQRRISWIHHGEYLTHDSALRAGNAARGWTLVVGPIGTR
jgi:hypothetical protein